MREQGDLLGKYRQREQKLQQIDSAQQEVLLQVKQDINGMEETRQRLVEEFRKVGSLDLVGFSGKMLRQWKICLGSNTVMDLCLEQ